MTFVCNAGPVIALAKIDHLGLLRDLAKTVLIPETVFFEVLAKPGRDSTRIRRASGEFLSIRNPSDTLDPAVVHESRRLDAGEREVITLASVTSRPVTAILDDAAGRRVATRLGIPVLGFIGLLIAAKQSHLVELVTPLIEQARQEGYWISDELLDIARNLANE